MEKKSKLSYARLTTIGREEGVSMHPKPLTPIRGKVAELGQVGVGIEAPAPLKKRSCQFAAFGEKTQELGEGNYPPCNACKITVYLIFLKTPVINVPYRWSA